MIYLQEMAMACHFHPNGNPNVDVMIYLQEIDMAWHFHPISLVISRHWMPTFLFCLCLHSRVHCGLIVPTFLFCFCCLTSAQYRPPLIVYVDLPCLTTWPLSEGLPEVEVTRKIPVRLAYLQMQQADMIHLFGLDSRGRFSYTYYDKNNGAIHQSIEALDRLGMEIIETGDPDAFKQYLQEYENTICGRHPISVLLHMLKHCSMKIKVGFVRYEQSSQCKSMRDSSVSYASAAAKEDCPGVESKD